MDKLKPTFEQLLEGAKIEVARGRGAVNCTYVLAAKGRAYPRTCKRCGPRHGSIVFSIGLNRALVQRVRTGPHLENNEIEDALYLLSALPKIEQLRAEQKQAA